ncbi:MAG: hypothetical protein O2968_09285 [Acidobacteria bacterium]|nr:hypothetical protein [Acidobacteriota bacterium]
MSGKDRMGVLPARYSFALNPHLHARFTTCPRCSIKTRVRKVPFVIHVDEAGLFVLRKTCRLCTDCDLVIVQQAEIEPLIAAFVDQTTAAKPTYLVLGTVDPRAWRRGLSAGATVDELIQCMADFKDHVRIEYTPGGWQRST